MIDCFVERVQEHMCAKSRSHIGGNWPSGVLFKYLGGAIETFLRTQMGDSKMMTHLKAKYAGHI